MNRSADDIFAAQIWAWPDPTLKRDGHGRVIFVNAAFLQLFGGNVEAWRGQVLQGWNPPQAGAQPNRFEIRTPAAQGYPEQVYDWIETVAQDGTALAIARNVTAFVALQAPAPLPAQSQAPQQFHTAEPPQTSQPSSQQSHMAAPAPELEPIQVAPSQAEPVQAAPAAPPTGAPASVPAQQVAAQAMAPQAVAPVATAVAPAPERAQQTERVADVAVAPTMAPVESNVVEVNPHAIAADVAGQRDADRDFQRRALPIENDEAVLGNNWRDAVIAKAVGGEDSVLPGLAKETSQTPTAKPDAIRILLAEDNAINALLTRTLLEADGHTVETVEDGALAVEAMKTQQFDMIFMDMRMPNMDGLESTRKIRALPNVSKDLPIVALTANAFDDDRNACFDSGMNDFMTKPVSAEELSEMVVRWTRRSEEKMAS